MNLFYQPRLSDGVTSLEGDEAHHALKVLRLTKGDRVSVTDGKGLRVEGLITEISKTTCGFSVTKRNKTPARSFAVHLFVAPTKSADRMEWLVEKATEIGVDSITLVACTRSERKKVGHERLVKTSVSAMKQSLQSWLPEIHAIVPFDEAIKKRYDQNFIAYVDHSNPDHLKNIASPGLRYGLLIGPEGDFTDGEVEAAIANEWRKVSLGANRLRTETAALAGCLTLAMINS